MRCTTVCSDTGCDLFPFCKSDEMSTFSTKRSCVLAVFIFFSRGVNVSLRVSSIFAPRGSVKISFLEHTQSTEIFHFFAIICVISRFLMKLSAVPQHHFGHHHISTHLVYINTCRVNMNRACLCFKRMTTRIEDSRIS